MEKLDHLTSLEKLRIYETALQLIDSLINGGLKNIDAFLLAGLARDEREATYSAQFGDCG